MVPFGAGGITDIVARQVGKGMGDALGQSIVVENRPGAGGVIAAQLASTAPADGYTIFMGTVGTQVVNPLIYAKLGYDADKFAPVGMVSGSPYLLAVRPEVPAATFGEFVAYARAHPAKLNFGSAGNASSPHLGLELLKLTAGVDIMHVPFKSGSEAVNAAIGGQVDVVMDASPVIMPHAARASALAVVADKRLPRRSALAASEAGAIRPCRSRSWNAFRAGGHAARGAGAVERRLAEDVVVADLEGSLTPRARSCTPARPMNTSVSFPARRPSGPRS